MLQGPDGCPGAVFQVQFIQEVADVGFDGFFADHHLFGNLAVGQSPGDQLQDLPLTLGQSLQLFGQGD